MGIKECEFWDMTIAELERSIESRQRMEHLRLQERATFDYIHAELVGRSIARLYSSSAKYPDISEAYPTIFNTQDIEEKKQEKKDELSALRFRQFANSFNANKEVAKENNERVND